jgi:hypothetical protein
LRDVDAVRLSGVNRGVQLCTGASRRNVRFARAYLQTGLSPWLDWRPLTRLEVRLSAKLSSLLLERPGGVDLVTSEADVVRCLGVGNRLLRRLAVTLGGRDARRAAGLSSLAGLLPLPTTVETRRLDAGVLDEDMGVVRIGSLSFAGVAGEFIGLANDRVGRCCPGVVDAERLDAGGERADERLNGLLRGMDERLAEPLRDPSGDSASFRKGEGVVRVKGLKLCPTTVSRKCVSEFQRGLGPGRSVGVFARA